MNTDALERALAGEVWAQPRPYRNLVEMCDRFGPRFAGTAGYARAAEWLQARMREYGLVNVHGEALEHAGWTRGEALLRVLSPYEVELPAFALAYSPSGVYEAELVDMSYGSAEIFAERGAQAAGKHALMTNADPPGYPRGIHRKEKYARAMQAGATGFVYASTGVGSLPFTGSLAFGQAGSIPGVSVSGEVAMALRRWLAAGPVRLQVIMRGGGSGPALIHNVVGELPGGPADGPQIILGGHLDTHDIAPGADDNGSGVVSALEAARALLAAGAAPRQAKVKVVLFAAEELGLLGAEAYVRAHQAELDDIRLVLNADCVGVGGGMGICTQKWPALTEALRAHMRAIDETANVNDGTVPFSDHFPFALQGVPAVMVSGGPGESGRGYGHTACDTVDKVSSNRLQGVALNLARLTLRVGSDAGWAIKRRAAHEVRDVLVSGGYDVALRMDGRWPFGD